MSCDHERQVYFGTKLPCPRRDCPEMHRAPDYTIAVMAPRNLLSAAVDAFNPQAVSAVRVLFERNADYTRWVPRPCVDAKVDAALTEKLVSGGLEAALIGHVKPKIERTADWECSSDGKTWIDCYPHHGQTHDAHRLSRLKARPMPPEIAAILAKGDPTTRLLQTINEALGRAATPRIGVPVAAWGVPRNPTPEPWRPSVDDWDLLPDA